MGFIMFFFGGLFLFIYYLYVFISLLSDGYRYKKCFLLDLIPFFGLFRIVYEKLEYLD